VAILVPSEFQSKQQILVLGRIFSAAGVPSGAQNRSMLAEAEASIFPFGLHATRIGGFS
jgi:hypothetical protein